MDKSWDILLGEQLGRLRKTTRSLRVAVMGIGHELQGDDAAGVLIARHLQSLLGPSEERLILCVGPAPENCTGALRRFEPDLVLWSWRFNAHLAASYSGPVSNLRTRMRDHLAGDPTCICRVWGDVSAHAEGRTSNCSKAGHFIRERTGGWD
jgi:hypothetical protein